MPKGGENEMAHINVTIMRRLKKRLFAVPAERISEDIIKDEKTRAFIPPEKGTLQWQCPSAPPEFLYVRRPQI